MRKAVTFDHFDLIAALDYDRAAGAFYGKRGSEWGHGAEVKRVDYVDQREGKGGRFVDFGGQRHSAARLAWFFVNGEWPDRRMRFLDGDHANIAWGNLALTKHRATREGNIARCNDYRKANLKAFRNNHLMNKFGIDHAAYQKKFVEQGGVCMLCAQAETEARGGQVKWLAVDHDHATGQVRDLLCSACNKMVGHAKEDPDRLRKAAAYLERHAGTEKVVPLRVVNEGDA